uniref:Purple acid phosphatase n=1 Tax=Manihot esculenta TaxID=3983 RepID=A0A2C9UF30_MANES
MSVFFSTLLSLSLSTSSTCNIKYKNQQMGIVSVFIFPLFFLLVLSSDIVHGDFPTTLQGPFTPVTTPLDKEAYHGNAVDLPDTYPQLQKNVEGFEPQQISVSLSSNYDSVWISWVTGAQNYTSGIIHHVRLTGLEPGELYQYQCGDPSIPVMSDIFYFRTMPVSSPTNYPRTIAVVGDLGLTYNTSTTFSHLLSNHPDLLVLVGGVSYADIYLTDGTSSDCYSCSFPQTPMHESYQPRWDYWGRFMQPLLANVPTMVVGGKHEIEEQAEDEIFAAYSSRFAFPSEESGSSSTLYYSFNAGADQYGWLENDLYNVDRDVTPWLVAAWYAPWYSTFKAHYREAECMRVEMEDMLYAYGVDIVFNGHVHAYERSNRVYNYSLDPCGPVYITLGAGGSREAIAIDHADDPGNCPEPSTTPDEYIGGFCAFNFTSGPAAGEFCWEQQPEYSAYRESSFGHGILEVKNETHALWSWHRNQDFYQVAGDIIYIVREPDRCLLVNHR